VGARPRRAVAAQVRAEGDEAGGGEGVDVAVKVAGGARPAVEEEHGRVGGGGGGVDLDGERHPIRHAHRVVGVGRHAGRPGRKNWGGAKKTGQRKQRGRLTKQRD